jgi:hypothetical protein
MPNRWPIASGNWSNAAIWSGSLIPTASDDVFANNFTVNVDTSFQALSLRNTSGTGITAGGSFNFNSGSISGSINSLVIGGNSLIVVSHNSGISSLTCTNNVSTPTNVTVISYTGASDFNLTIPNSTINTGDNTTTTFINKTGTGTLTINSNLILIKGGGGTYENGRIITSTAGNTVINGNLVCPTAVGGSITNLFMISQTSGNLKIVGDVVHSTGGYFNTPMITFGGNNLDITGSISGGSNTLGISTTATNINISGSIIGGVSYNALSCTSAATINVVGTIIAGSGAAAIALSGASVLTYSGSLASSANQPAIISSNVAATNIFTGPFTNTNNTMAVQCADMVLTTDASTTWNFGNITLFSPERLAFYPSASDIRQGTTYADGTVSGSLAMPPATAVIAGTPTDNTTGSAVLTPAQLQDAVWGRDLSQMTETGSIGNRLARVSTTGTTGAQIASYLL